MSSVGPKSQKTTPLCSKEPRGHCVLTAPRATGRGQMLQPATTLCLGHKAVQIHWCMHFIATLHLQAVGVALVPLAHHHTSLPAIGPFSSFGLDLGTHSEAQRLGHQAGLEASTGLTVRECTRYTIRNKYRYTCVCTHLYMYSLCIKS